MTTPPPPCRCGHDAHDGPCPYCLCREHQPDDHVYPAGPMVAS